MIKKGIVTSLLIFVCSVFFCCSSMEWKEWEENKDYYLIRYIGDYSFKKYYLISMMNYKHQIFHLLSEKSLKNEKPPFKEYENLKAGFYYKVKFSKIDSIIELESMVKKINGGVRLIIAEEVNGENIEIWSEDTLRVPMYSSENIYGLYVEILE